MFSQNQYRLITGHENSFIECLPLAGVIASEQDALEWVAVCGENSTDRLLIGSENLSDEFFDLSTTLAGMILLKFSNYRIRAAALLPPERVTHGKFPEMVVETNRGNLFRIYFDRSLAEAWLLE